ncbi:MAG: DNA-protecting protein DprA, partial [Lentisphaeria bacterium]|nr:DNA-protecting protein DprA [Lentisphaeria bacterium]
NINDWQNMVDLQKELSLLEQYGIDVITYMDEGYPDLLKEISDPPLLLYCKGNLSLLKECKDHSLAVVGSRRTSSYGEKMTENLVRAASMAGWIIISGLARGIDTFAHQQTLKQDGYTIAVLGGGLLEVYPYENKQLAAEIAVNGLVISEQPLTMKPDKRTFPMRNRIVAGMSMGTLVIEAGSNSGSIITATKAKEMGKRVFAVPGRADSALSQGCHTLIKEGAKLTESLDDIVKEFTVLPGFEKFSDLEPIQTLAPKVVIPLNQDEQKIVELLEATELSMDDIVNKSGIGISQCLTLLMSMELKRIVRQLPGKRFTLK